MVDKLFFISLVLNATGLFRFVASPFGVSVGQVSMVLLVFNVIYLLIKLLTLIPMFSKMTPWIVVLTIWPLVTLIYASTIDIREIALAIYGFALFAATVVYTVSNGFLERTQSHSSF